MFCTSRQRHQEVWQGTVTTDASGVTLTGHSRATTSWECWHTGVCSTRRQCTYQTAAFQSVNSLHGGIYAPLHVISWLYLDIISALSGRLLSLVRRCSTICQSARWSTRSRTQHINLRTIVKDTSFLCLSACNALYKCTILTYLLTIVFTVKCLIC